MRMRKKVAVLTAAIAVVLGGCTWVSEPWDNTGYFKQERIRSEEQQKQLRERVFHSQIDQDRPAHQTDGS